MTSPPSPMSLLAELTHRCPLSCPYCSNPLALERKSAELDHETWRSILKQAADMGVLQVHFSGGEPMARPDLPELIRYARELGLYSNLITSGFFLDRDATQRLKEAGLDHIQLSFQDLSPEGAERMSGRSAALPRKLEALPFIREAELSLTLNFVLQRGNIDRLPQFFALARDAEADRIEIAHTQYYGWALKNRAALLPSRAQLEAATEIVEKERARGGLAIDYVTPDYYADRPKPCMGGWGRRFINVTPSGRVLPCHAAETLPDVTFPSVRDSSLAEIWERSELFSLFRGTAWMPEPCASCDRKEIDWGGCRCQALALTGQAANTDPVCSLSPFHARVEEALNALPPEEDLPALSYRRF